MTWEEVKADLERQLAAEKARADEFEGVCEINGQSLPCRCRCRRAGEGSHAMSEPITCDQCSIGYERNIVTTPYVILCPKHAAVDELVRAATPFLDELSNRYPFQEKPAYSPDAHLELTVTAAEAIRLSQALAIAKGKPMPELTEADVRDAQGQRRRAVVDPGHTPERH
jgi:hypothetical protein